MLISGKVTLKCWQKACNDEYCFQLEVLKVIRIQISKIILTRYFILHPELVLKFEFLDIMGIYRRELHIKIEIQHLACGIYPYNGFKCR